MESLADIVEFIPQAVEIYDGLSHMFKELVTYDIAEASSQHGTNTAYQRVPEGPTGQRKGHDNE